MNQREPDPAGRNEPSSLDWARDAGVADAVVQEVGRQVRRRRQRSRRRFAVAALFVMLATGLSWHFTRPVSLSEERSSAVVSVPQRRVLPDGTVVELDSGARIRVAFEAEAEGPRRVELLSGAAHFQVTKNPQRPFIVAAGKIEVRAVGTAFAVQLAQAGVEVLVTEGRVAVDPPTPPANDTPTTTAVPMPLAVLDAGNRTVVASTQASPPKVLPLPAEEMLERLAWRAPRLEFTDTQLGEVLRLFNEHCSVPLALGDESLATLRLSGIVRADNTSALLQLLSVEYGVDAKRGAEGELVLVRAR